MPPIKAKRGRSLTARQMLQFRALVGKEMQLRAERDQMTSQRSTSRNLQRKPASASQSSASRRHAVR